MGSGAGLPGILLKIIRPRFKTCLLEINSRKCNFLKQVIRLLGLEEIEVISGRIENEGTNLHSGGSHLITARAFAGLEKTIETCAPLLSPEGLLISFSGQRAEEDIERCRHRMKIHGIALEKMISYFLPGKKSKRNTLIFKKKGNEGTENTPAPSL